MEEGLSVSRRRHRLPLRPSLRLSHSRRERRDAPARPPAARSRYQRAQRVAQRGAPLAAPLKFRSKIDRNFSKPAHQIYENLADVVRSLPNPKRKEKSTYSCLERLKTEKRARALSQYQMEKA